MTRQYRIERYQGVEFLVCEFYNRHTWTKSEVDAFSKCFDEKRVVSQDDFRHLLDDWLLLEHSPSDTFYGLSESIPVIEYLPCVVVRGAVVDNKIASVACDFQRSVTSLEVMDCIGKLFEFVRSPHWRNTILRSISDYGTLFGPDNDC